MRYIETEKQVVHFARKKFLAMAGAYCLGVFNDNFFKQAVLLIAVSSGLSHFQGYATVLFALPFILFSSYAGWLADKLPKKKVVIGSKALEVIAMLIGAIGLISGNWICILAMVFLMGAQSAFFNPALNGSIPELYPENYVPRANAILKLTTTLAILAGIALSGISLDQNWMETQVFPFGNLLVGCIVVFVAVIGFIISLGAYSRPASGNTTPLPWLGPISSIRDLSQIIRDRHLRTAIIADTFFYFLASLVVLTINVFGLEQLDITQTATSLMSMTLTLGICIGSILVARQMSMQTWSRHLVIAALGIGAGLAFAGLTIYMPVALQQWLLAGSLSVTGIAGGFFLIPVASFLQVHPAASQKGRVLATANFCCFVAILLSGFVFSLIHPACSPSTIMMMLGALACGAGILLLLFTSYSEETGRPVLGWLLRQILSLRYSIHVRGMNSLDLDDTKGVLFLPNHPAIIDPVIVMSCLYKNHSPRPLSDVDQVSKPVIRQIMKLVNPITLPDLHKHGRSGREKVREALDKVICHLRQGDRIILYPAGRLYRSAKEDLAGNSGVESILKKVPETQIVLVRTTGLWGSSFSRATSPAPSIFHNFRKLLWAVLANGIFFMPKREVTIELVKDGVTSSLPDRRTINAHLENFYNQKIQSNTYVPYFWWQGRRPRILEEPTSQKTKRNTDHIASTIKKQVITKLNDVVGYEVKENDSLAKDLAIDSLTLMELVAWLESEFGATINDSSALTTVEDCILAASNRTATGAEELQISKIAQQWFKNEKEPPRFEKGATIAEIFLNQAKKNPGKILFADQISGAKNYRNLLTAIFALRPCVENITEKNVGILLPASVVASTTYLTTILCGKTPVMFNWTSGIGNMAHGVKITKTKTILTVKKLYMKIEEQQGVDLSKLLVNWVFLDEVAASLTPFHKISALAKSYLLTKTLRKTKVSETAAILFTSGSESQPKAVPLTHQNILTNMVDFSSIVTFKENSSLLGMLPPFHSLGLVGTIILPLCMGLKTIFHANPTEPVILAKLIDEYKVSMTIGTPTFIDGILQSGSPRQLRNLELVFTGAEKCPSHIYNKLKAVSPKAVLCEGYGITECSPLVSINVPGHIKEGTIGSMLPSIEYAIVDPESNKRVPRNTKGLLLVRGKSIFNGYLNDTTGKGFLNFEGKRWYDTGDFVSEDRENILTFKGRQKRFIKLAGEMISLPAIENVLLKKYNDAETSGPSIAVEATAIDGHPEIVLFTTFNIERDLINMTLKNGGLSPLHNIRRVEKISEIPVLGTGKTDYRTLQQLLA